MNINIKKVTLFLIINLFTITPTLTFQFPIPAFVLRFFYKSTTKENPIKMTDTEIYTLLEEYKQEALHSNESSQLEKYLALHAIADYELCSYLKNKNIKTIEKFIEEQSNIINYLLLKFKHLNELISSPYKGDNDILNNHTIVNHTYNEYKKYEDLLKNYFDTLNDVYAEASYDPKWEKAIQNDFIELNAEKDKFYDLCNKFDIEKENFLKDLPEKSKFKPKL